MHLVQAYARTAGLRIDKMLLTEQFYPIGIDEPFVLVVTSSGASGKNYSYFQMAVNYLRPLLKKKGYKIVQAGGKDDERIGADVDLCGKTSIPQYFYVVSRSSLVLSGDTSVLHAAGHYNKKLVSLFSISSPEISGSWYGDKNKQVYLTPPNGWRPSFNPNEFPKQIDQILPEKVVGAVSNLLDLDAPLFDSVYIGNEFRVTMIDSVPNAVVRPDFLPHIPLTIRYDKGGDERHVYEQLRYRKAVLITDKPLNLEILHQLRPNIEGLIYIVTENDDPKFVEALHRNAFPYRLVSMMSEEDLQAKKLDYIEFALLERKDKDSKENTKLLAEIGDRTFFTSNKRILSDNKAYLSYAHLEANKHLDNFAQSEDNVLDTPAFWEGVDFYHIYNK